MKCPHCGRAWSDADLDVPGLSPTLMLDDHVRRFCAGEPPQAHATVRARRATPQPRSARRARNAAPASPPAW